MADRLSGRVAIVTGGCRGIGAAIAQRFVEEGASVTVLDVDTRPAGGWLESLEGCGSTVRLLDCDIGIEDEVRDAVRAVEREVGAVGILVNNAGVNAYFDATEMTGDDWERVFAVDLKGAWHCAKYTLPGMVAARRGPIINIASIHAFATTRGMFPYAAASGRSSLGSA